MEPEVNEEQGAVLIDGYGFADRYEYATGYPRLTHPYHQ
jgi:hypothetical protein